MNKPKWWEDRNRVIINLIKMCSIFIFIFVIIVMKRMKF